MKCNADLSAIALVVYGDGGTPNTRLRQNASSVEAMEGFIRKACKSCKSGLSISVLKLLYQVE